MQQVGVPGVTNGQHPHYLSAAPPEEKKRDGASSVSPHNLAKQAGKGYYFPSL